jgi:hypothetical protein
MGWRVVVWWRAMRPTFRRGYNAAFRAMRQHVAGMQAAGSLTTEQRQSLASVAALCRGMRLPTRPKPRLATFAARYSISLRTVKYWKRAGCPFAAGHWAVLTWMCRRRTLPAGPRRKFAREFQQMAFADATRAAMRAKAHFQQTRDLPAQAALALRLRLAMQAAETMDAPTLLCQGRKLHRLAKAAKQSGLWE